MAKRLIAVREDRMALWYKLLFLTGVTLRVILSLLNGDANDDHISVIRALAFEDHQSASRDHWESFQPKLYHSTVAAILQIANFLEPMISSIPAIHVRVGNLLACAAGIVTLWIVLKWLQQVDISRKSRLLTFSILALNPKLIAINSQTTNDSFVIMFGTIAIYFGYMFFRFRFPVHFVYLLAASILAGLSKGNGIVVFLIAICVFAVGILRPALAAGWERVALIRWAVVFVTVYLGSLALFGPYLNQYRSTESPFTINIKAAPPPGFLKKTEAYRPGIRSIVDGFLTFRLVDLLREPRNIYTPLARETVELPYDESKQFYPDHQTSLWSQLYARFHSVHFDYWPFSWRLDSSAVVGLIRVALLLGLLPSVLLVTGLASEALLSMRWVCGRSTRPYGLSNLLLVICAYGFLAFVVAYAFRYRDYGVLKVIFIFPGLLGFAWCFSRSYDRLRRDLGKFGKAVASWVDIVIMALLATYVVDIVILIGHQFMLKVYPGSAG